MVSLVVSFIVILFIPQAAPEVMGDTSRRLIFFWVLGAREALETFVGVFNVTHPVVRHN